MIKFGRDVFLKSFTRLQCCHLGGGTPLACLPMPKCDELSLGVGMVARLGRSQLQTDPIAFNEFKAFVRRAIEAIPEFNRPIQLPDEYKDWFSYFIMNANYDAGRKAQLTELWNSLNEEEHKQQKFTVNKTFEKYEHYPACKYARGIYARHDVFKCFFGGVSKAMEADVFSRPEFIKKIPCSERAEYLMENMYEVGAKYFSSDFESFESLFTREIMEACEIALYEKKMANYPEDFKYISSVLLSDNHLKAKNITGTVSARRMSGEMCTSLGNGFTNLMVSWFLLYKSGISLQTLASNLHCVIEGDDSLVKFKTEVDMTLYEKIGFRSKFVIHEHIGDASFCGMLFDDEERIIVTDITKHCIALFWGDRKYVDSRDTKKLRLLRAKCLSYAYQYRGCPVLDKLVHHFLKLTRGLDVRHVVLDKYKNEILMQALEKSKDIIKAGPLEPGMKTRLLIQEQFGVTVSMQLYLESKIDTFTLGYNDDLALLASDEACEYARKHVRLVLDVNDVNYEHVYITPKQLAALKPCMKARDYQVLCEAIR